MFYMKFGCLFSTDPAKATTKLPVRVLSILPFVVEGALYPVIKGDQKDADRLLQATVSLFEKGMYSASGEKVNLTLVSADITADQLLGMYKARVLFQINYLGTGHSRGELA